MVSIGKYLNVNKLEKVLKNNRHNTQKGLQSMAVWCGAYEAVEIKKIIIFYMYIRP